MKETNYNSISSNDSKQIDFLLQECLNITEDILNKEYGDNEFQCIVDSLSEKLSEIRCYVNPLYKQICDDVREAMIINKDETP